MKQHNWYVGDRQRNRLDMVKKEVEARDNALFSDHWKPGRIHVVGGRRYRVTPKGWVRCE